MDKDFVIIGLPSSGKTTFLAALWHMIEAGEVSCRLKLGQWEGYLQYLNSIAEAWRSFSPVPRTSQIGDQDVTIQLIDSETGFHGAAFFPDLAGETFDGQVETRRCRPRFLENVQKEGGILLFISADSKQDGLSIVELNAQFPDGVGEIIIGEPNEKPSGPETVEGEAASAAIQQPAEWSPAMVLGQVRVVQVLSDLIRPPFAPRRRRLAVIISAWDLVTPGTTPEAWLAGQMPLVDQFLRANDCLFDTKLYGVSAQGVKLDDPVAVQQAAKLTPSDRIRILSADGEGKDLTTPLVWLMSA